MKKETLKETIKKLHDNFILNNVYLFVDLDEDKLCLIDYNAEQVQDVIQYYSISSVKRVVKEILKNSKDKFDFEPENDNVKKIVDNIRNIKKAFNRNKNEFFVGSNGIFALNMFKRTELLDYQSDEKYNYEEITKLINEKFPRLEILLKNNIGDKKEIKWFLDWISMEINEPSQIMTTFIIIGNQGSGKSVLIENIFKNIYHSSNVSTLDNKTLNDNFNDIYNYKSFVIMNEVSTMDLRTNNQIAQELKRLITDGTIIIRGMHKAGKEMTKSFNMCFTTNKDIPLQIEQGDRRFTIFSGGKSLIKNYEKEMKEFGGTKKFIEDVKEEIKEFLKYLKFYNYDADVGINTLENEYKKRIINVSSKKEDSVKYYIQNNDFIAFRELLISLDFDCDEDCWQQLEYMFKAGIFTNEILNNIYDVLFADNSNSDVAKGKWWNNVLNTDGLKIKVNKKQYRYKFINTENLELKKDNLKKILAKDFDNIIISEEVIDIDNEEIPF